MRSAEKPAEDKAKAPPKRGESQKFLEDTLQIADELRKLAEILLGAYELDKRKRTIERENKRFGKI